MRKIKPFEAEEDGKFMVGEAVYSKGNVALKMTVLRYSGMRYYCGYGDKKSQKEVMYFEDDLISEWQVPFFKG